MNAERRTTLPPQAHSRRFASSRGSIPLLALCSLLVTLSSCPFALSASYPSWWTNRNVVTNVVSTNDYAGANSGQVKWFCTNAYDELTTYLPGGAGTGVLSLIQGFSTTNNYIAINQGQLKNTGKPFWDRLIEEGYTNGYPWTAATNDDANYSGANIGQTKTMFTFELRIDGDGDGLANWREDGSGIFVNPYNTGSSATNSDSDGDGINDGVEITARTDPNSNDTTRPSVTIVTPANNYSGVWIP